MTAIKPTELATEPIKYKIQYSHTYADNEWWDLKIDDILVYELDLRSIIRLYSSRANAISDSTEGYNCLRVVDSNGICIIANSQGQHMMAKSQQHKQWLVSAGKKLCEALGIDPNRTSKVVITFDAEWLPVIEVHQFRCNDVEAESITRFLLELPWAIESYEAAD